MKYGLQWNPLIGCRLITVSIFSQNRRRVAITMATLISRDCDVTFTAVEQHYIAVSIATVSRQWREVH